MYTPLDSFGAEQSTVSNGDTTNRVGSVEHYLCGAGSFFLTVGFAILFYPYLVSLTAQLEMLATTALVSTLVVIWAIGWIGFELLWEWRAGRWSPS